MLAPSVDVSCNEVLPESVLVLGDGNFSFSYALCSYLYSCSSSRPTPLQGYASSVVYATSFDDVDSLLDKYPETSGMLHTLQNKYCCQHVIFNFPHLGVEDAYLHSHLLGHIFFRCHEAISSSGNVYISLAEGQAKRWRLKEMASKNGFDFITSGTFLQQHLPGYEMKRHQTGRSFAARLDDTNYYVFRKTAFTGNTGDIIGALLASCNREATLKDTSRETSFRILSNPDNSTDVATATKRQRVGPNGSTINDALGCVDSNKLSKKSLKKRGKMAAAEDGYTRVVSTISKPEDALAVYEFECKKCFKRFKLEQGARTHVYMIHIIGQEEELKVCATNLMDPTNPATSKLDARLSKTAQQSLPCDICHNNNVERSFQNEEALLQHIRAKHNTPEVPETYKGPISATRITTEGVSGSSASIDVSNARLACPACDLKFLSEDLLNQHIEEGISPPTVVKEQCQKCLNYFQNERGLVQHMMSCRA